MNKSVNNNNNINNKCNNQNNNSIIINSKDKHTYNIKVNSPTKLSFLTKKQIYGIRNSLVSQYHGIIAPGYKPSDTVYGQMTDNKQWVALKSMFCEEEPLKNAGLSEESRFFNNPLFLIGLDNYLVFLKDLSVCNNLHPPLVSITYQPANKKIVVIYNLIGFFTKFEKNGVSYKNLSIPFMLKAENARDFGYNYVYVNKSNKVYFSSSPCLSKEVIQINQYIHTVNDCGYRGSCTDGLHPQREFFFNVKSLPASISFSLWKKMPVNKQVNADFNYEMILK